MINAVLSAVNDFHFIRPQYLFFLIPVCVLLAIMRSKHKSNFGWKHLIDAPFLLVLTDQKGTVKSQPTFVICAFLLILTVTALSGPAWEKHQVQHYQSPSALVAIWDLSPSMTAQDIKPSRTVRSRLKLIDLFNAHQDGLNALIVYSGEAHIVTPLTDDTNTIISLMNSLDTHVLPSQGSNIEMAFTIAHKMLEDSGIEKGSIVVLTDGIVDGAREELRSLNRNSRHKITIWGIGTRQGAPILLNDGSYARNAYDEIIMANLDEDKLSAIASENLARYIPFSADDFDIQSITQSHFTSSEVNNVSELKSDKQDTDKRFDRWKDTGPLFLLPCLFLAALLFRRGWLLCFMLIGIALPNDKAYALELRSFLLTPDQKGMRAFENSDHERAAALFEDSNWRATASYMSGNFEAAARDYAQGQTADAAFNLGNALVHQGDYKGAIGAYETALKRDPNYDDAKINMEIVM